MKILATIALMVCQLSLQAQTPLSKTSSESNKREFKNQGEQEDFWAEQLFAKEYTGQAYNRYGGYIKVSDNVFVYGKQRLVLSNTRDELYKIFSMGLFYPSVINEYTTEKPKSKKEFDAMTALERAIYDSTETEIFAIANLEESAFLSESPARRRFRFWLYRKELPGPQVCFIELFNGSATHQTDFKTFLDGAKLTFYKAAWLVI